MELIPRAHYAESFGTIDRDDSCCCRVGVAIAVAATATSQPHGARREAQSIVLTTEAATASLVRDALCSAKRALTK